MQSWLPHRWFPVPPEEVIRGEHGLAPHRREVFGELAPGIGNRQVGELEQVVQERTWLRSRSHGEAGQGGGVPSCGVPHRAFCFARRIA